MPLLVKRMERHPSSTQTFIPIGTANWVAVVAPKNAHGKPDMIAARAFKPLPGQALRFHPDVWHLPLTVFNAPAGFAVSQWKTGDKRDEEFVDVTSALVV